jgi:hypothetical protein
MVSVTGIAGTQRRRDERPRGVVNENDVGLLARQRFESGAHRILARGPAIGRRRVPQFADGVIEHRGVVGVQDRLHRENLWMTAKWLHRAEDHRLPADRTVLFRPTRTGAKPASGCDKDGCSPFRFRHGAKIADDSRGGRGSVGCSRPAHIMMAG